MICPDCGVEMYYDGNLYLCGNWSLHRDLFQHTWEEIGRFGSGVLRRKYP